MMKIKLFKEWNYVKRQFECESYSIRIAISLFYLELTQLSDNTMSNAKMAPLSFLMVFLRCCGQVFRAVRDGDNPDGAPERSGTPGSDSIGPHLDSTQH